MSQMLLLESYTYTAHSGHHELNFAFFLNVQDKEYREDRLKNENNCRVFRFVLLFFLRSAADFSEIHSTFPCRFYAFALVCRTDLNGKIVEVKKNGNLLFVKRS